jgi:hypothetical protein
VIPGVGLVVFSFYYDPDTDTFPDGNLVPLVGSMLAKLLTGNFTYVVEFHAQHGEFADVLRVSVVGDTTGKRAAIESSTGDYFLAFDLLLTGVDDDVFERDLTMDADVPDSLLHGIHVVAFTRTDDRLAISIDGGVVKFNSDPQASFDSIPLTHAWLGGDSPAPYGQVLIGRIQVFDPQDDEALPGLSVVTVMTPPANDALSEVVSGVDWPDPPSVFFSATMGETYYIAVAGQGGGEGLVEIEVTETP